MIVKEVIEQSNVINLYYLNFLGTVMLRPVLVTLGSGAGGDSSPSTLLTLLVHLSTRFLLGTCFFKVVAEVIWGKRAIFLVCTACFSFSFCCFFWACSWAFFSFSLSLSFFTLSLLIRLSF
jgi:hypothetical protein